MLVEKFPAFVLALAALAWLSSSFVFLEPGEQALPERFGQPLGATLGPGAHLKWPWPVETLYRFDTGKIQSFNVGIIPDPKLANEKTIVWTVTHNKEEFNFLVATRAESESVTNASGGEQAVPVNLLTVSIPVQYRIADVRAWAYGHAAADTLLEQAATREVVRYLAGVDFLEIMSDGRERAASELREKIQTRANELKLGVEILFVGLQDIHPPTTVAGDFEAVNGAAQDVESKILRAQGTTNKTLLLAQADANRIVSVAEGGAMRRTTSAAAQAVRFENQIAAFDAAPTVYPQRLYLQTFATASAGVRKYVIAPTNTQDVVQLNLEDKLRPDLLDINVEPPKQ
jgi:regulator of protease activity HflC (stomatin/prohibitin superfamily)